MKPLKLPNLPQNKVSHMLCGYNSSIFSALLDNSIVPVDCGKGTFLSKYVDSHADMLCTHLGNKVFLVDKDTPQTQNALRELGFTVLQTKKRLGIRYPDDCALNCAVIGDKLVCNTKYVDSSLLNYFENNDLEIIHTNQGYAKCNICIAGEKAVITSDKSIYESLHNKIDVLLIEDGHILLDGYDSGFIGGCSGLTDKYSLVFTGDIEMHPSFHDIKNFLDERMIHYMSLLPGKPLIDIGSLIPILEYD